VFGNQPRTRAAQLGFMVNAITVYALLDVDADGELGRGDVESAGGLAFERAA